MTLTSRPEEWNSQVASDMQWQSGRAQALCPHLEGCGGPSVSNLGNVESGFIAIGACRNQCAHAIRSALPGAIVFPEDPNLPVYQARSVPEEIEESVVSTVEDEA